MQQQPRRSLEAIPEEITPMDHEILRHGSTSSNLERLPSRLQRSKRVSTDLRQQLEDLSYEVGYLRAEVQWHKESKHALLQFQEDVFRLFQSMEESLVRVNSRVRESERQYRTLLGLDSNGYNEGNMI